MRARNVPPNISTHRRSPSGPSSGVDLSKRAAMLAATYTFAPHTTTEDSKEAGNRDLYAFLLIAPIGGIYIIWRQGRRIYAGS
jgi:hypothetical protein